MVLQVVITSFSTVMFKDQRQAAFRCTQPDLTRICWGMTTMQENAVSDKNRKWGCISCLDALLSNIRIFSMYSEVFRVLMLLLVSHQLTAPFMACSKCWFYDRAVSCSYGNELRAWGKGSTVGRQRDGDIRKERSRRCVEEKEACVLMHGFSSHVSQAVGREKGVCLWVFVLHEAVGSWSWKAGGTPCGQEEGNEHWEGKMW